MRLFDFIDNIEKPTTEDLHKIYKVINMKYDEIIDLALEPNSQNYKKWTQTLDCLKQSENMIIDCMSNDEISDMEWLQLKCNIYRFQVKYGGLKYAKIE